MATPSWVLLNPRSSVTWMPSAPRRNAGSAEAVSEATAATIAWNGPRLEEAGLHGRRSRARHPGRRTVTSTVPSAASGAWSRTLSTLWVAPFGNSATTWTYRGAAKSGKRPAQ